MEKQERNAPYAVPPEYKAGAEREYGVPGPEFTPLPPEFGQRSGPSGAEEKKRRPLRWVLILPLLALLGFLCWKTEPESPPEPGPEREPTEGTVVIDLVRAGTAADKAYYTYSVYTPIPSLDATDEQIEQYKNGTPWPVAVYASVTDANANAAVPENDPDVWTGPRDLQDGTIDVSGLEGELTLTLLARYTEQGEERETKLSVLLQELSAEPTLTARLEVFPGGDIDVTAGLIPAPGDEHDYQLHVKGMGQTAYENGESMGFSLGEAYRRLEVEGDNESGYYIHYEGGSIANSLPEDAEYSVTVIFEDLSDGKVYSVETNRVSLYGIHQEALPDYPLGDGTIVITVFNDTTNFEFPDLPTAEDGYRTLLDSVTIPEAEFETYSLPSAWTPDGYDFAGWVVHVGSPLDPGGGEDVFSEYHGDPPVEAMLPEGSFAFPLYGELTKQEVEKVPPGEDGVRYVNLHAVWIRQEPRENYLYLFDGFDGYTVYDMIVPMASEGFLYLCNYPEPQQDGWEFDGWYDEEGNRVDMLVCYFSFTPAQYDAEGNFEGYDWNGKKTVTLTAHWK